MKTTRLLPLLLLLALLLTLPLAPRAEALVVGRSGNCGRDGDNLTWSYADGVLTIEGSGAMADYDKTDGQPWHEQAGQITAVSLPEGLSSVGARAFYNCVNLREIALPDSVESIGDFAFGYCALSEIRLPAGLAALGINPFVSRGTLKSIVLPAENRAFTLADGVLFSRDGKTLLCYPTGLSAEQYDVPAGVETIARTAFAHAENLRSLTLPESLSAIGNQAFHGCKNLGRVTLPESLTEIGKGAFGECAALTLSALEGSYAAQYCAENSLNCSLIRSGVCGLEADNLRWELRGGVLTIRGEGEMMPLPARSTGPTRKAK